MQKNFVFDAKKKLKKQGQKNIAVFEVKNFKIDRKNGKRRKKDKKHLGKVFHILHI